MVLLLLLFYLKTVNVKEINSASAPGSSPDGLFEKLLSTKGKEFVNQGTFCTEMCMQNTGTKALCPIMANNQSHMTV